MSDNICGENMLQNAASSILEHSALQNFIFPQNLFPFTGNTSQCNSNEPIFCEEITQPCLQRVSSNPQHMVQSEAFWQKQNHPYWTPQFMFPNALLQAGIQHQFTPSLNLQNPRADDTWLNSISRSGLQNREFPDNDVKHFNINDQPTKSYEEKRAESKFYKFLHDYKTGTFSSEIIGEEATADRLSVNETEDKGSYNPLECDIQETGHVELPQTQDFSSYSDDRYHTPIEDDCFVDGHSLGQIPYPFQKNNKYLHHPNPFNEAEILLQNGAIAEATLAFEAECQREGPHPNAWFSLGTTQQENEKDFLAILALQNAVQVDEAEPFSYVALATSQTNEYMYTDAIKSLEKWAQKRGILDINGIPSVGTKALENILQNACVLNESDIEFKIALGTLCNIIHDYNQGISVFESAVKLSPKSAHLWNKLGATLANSGNSSQALEAYHQALEIAPGSHRSRYNLAVAHMNCQQNSKALHELIRILKGQEAAERDFSGDLRRKSHDIWNLIRINVELLGCPDMLECVENEDIAALERKFGFL